MGKLAAIFIFYIYFFMPYLLGFDPGRDKCGVAVVESFREDISLESYQVRQHQVFLASAVVDSLRELCQQFPITMVVMGDGNDQRMATKD